MDEEDEETSTTRGPVLFLTNQPHSAFHQELVQPAKRPYGSGLGNLGNTCFMNSTLQCLAHTEPLQRYFLTGEFRDDLNRRNPLGTGGDLATQFAKLLADMWTGATGVVYPREFKNVLGKHAEQFVGYEQHDSQELATYLLDALHEDCNRVTQKPYVEKPEQGANESDLQASAKAWELHLRRDDSRVLENFMGQIKSRVQCPVCKKVSTTFDPFMYLSVPIPGAEEKNIPITYVPLNPDEKPQNIVVRINKQASIQELVEKTFEIRSLRGKAAPSLSDVAVCDVWKSEIFDWIKQTEDVERIRDTDTTFIYELQPVADLQPSRPAPKDPDELKMASRPRKYQPTIDLLAKLNREWKETLRRYFQNPRLAFEVANAKVEDHDMVSVYNRIVWFLTECDKSLHRDGEETGQKRARDEMNSDSITMAAEAIIREKCDGSTLLKNVESKHDLAAIEFCAGQIRKQILAPKCSAEHPDGVVIEVRNRHRPNNTNPLALRVSSSATVSDLRELIAHRMKRALITSPTAGEPTAEGLNDVLSSDASILRQVPLCYDRRHRFSNNRGPVQRQLGSLSKHLNRFQPGNDLARKDQDEEKELVADKVGDEGVVLLEWPIDLQNRVFDKVEYEAVEELEEAEPAESMTINVLDCIEKFCQEEELEKSEQWYCSRCKEHVCAWKQVHVYRSPPHLIVHLKRFQFTARSHRRQKIDSFIDFPLHGLDLSNHVKHWTPDEKPIYDCYAVSNHYGGLGGGHYTAHALNGDVWCYYDDSRIQANIDPREVVSEAAYVLYYRRRDVPIQEEFEVDFEGFRNDMKRPAIIPEAGKPSFDHHKLPSSSKAAVVAEDDDYPMTTVGDSSENSYDAVQGQNDESDDEHYNLESTRMARQ